MIVMHKRGVRLSLMARLAVLAAVTVLTPLLLDSCDSTLRQQIELPVLPGNY